LSNIQILPQKINNILQKQYQIFRNRNY